MRYAAYGSNLHPLRLAERLHSPQLLGVAQSQHWSLRFHKLSKDASGKCSIVPGGDGVCFAIFEITREDKRTLDRIEGVGSGYAATSLRLSPFGDCATYIAEESHIDDSLRPYDWYRELVLAGARFHGFPNDYVNRIESVQPIADPDAARSAAQWVLAETIRNGS